MERSDNNNRTGRYSLLAALLLLFLAVGLFVGTTLNLSSGQAGGELVADEPTDHDETDAVSALDTTGDTSTDGTDASQDGGVDQSGEPASDEPSGDDPSDDDPGPGPGCGVSCVGPTDELGEPPTPQPPFNPGLGTKPTPTPTPEKPGSFKLPEQGPGPDPTAPPPGPGGFITN